MAKSSFLRKLDWKKGQDVFLKTILRVGGGLAGLYLSNKVLPTLMIQQGQENAAQPKIAPWITLAVGAVGATVINNDYAQAFAEGVAMAGGVDAASDIIFPTQKDKFGLLGMGSLGASPQGFTPSASIEAFQRSLSALAESSELDGDELYGDELYGDELDGDELDGDELDGDELDGDELDGDELDGDELDGDELDGNEFDEFVN